ncbi:MAG: hypothetical protein PHG65_11030 [Kiritimatiellae bacterium]|nr:hypothetical protein [Kiritimatiellia bacterium]
MPERIIPLLENVIDRRSKETIAAAYAEQFMTPEAVFGELIAVLREVEDRPMPGARNIPAPGLLSRLRNYPIRKVFYYYAAALLSRFLQRSGGGSAQGGRLLEKYIQLRWRALARDEGVLRVAIYGAGKHSYWLMHVLRDEQDIDVVAVLDDHPALDREGPFHQTPVLSRTFDPTTVDAIILSSDCIQEKLAKRCRELYGPDVKLVDLYEGLPPGPYSK